jgi:hypothetical protein
MSLVLLLLLFLFLLLLLVLLPDLLPPLPFFFALPYLLWRLLQLVLQYTTGWHDEFYLHLF